ncbi:MAG TPA: GntR family transcriptional regulator, partial [Opitutaceae bacterium]|nr:GntR family transcriptional regulator [Opitutaceae bacterium]
MSGEFGQGYPLLPESLAAEMQIGRTPIREALQRLSAEGLVTINPHVGAAVKTMDLREYREICQIRLVLEGSCAALTATHRSPAQLAEIKYALEGLRKLTALMNEPGEHSALWAELLKQDVRFHLAIINSSGNRMMKNEIIRLNIMKRLMVGPHTYPSGTELERKANRAKVMESHDEIYDSIARGDSRAARDAMEAHFHDAMRKIMDVLADQER